MRTFSTVFLVLASACSSSTSPSSQIDMVAFMVDGQVHEFHSNTELVNGDVHGKSFTLGASKPAEGIYLYLSLSAYAGPATYALGAAGPGFGRVIIDGHAYETTSPNDGGSLTISSALCSTRTAYDPVTGITSPETTCHAEGRFAFAGVSETGETVAVTEGEFHVTSIRGAD